MSRIADYPAILDLGLGSLLGRVETTSRTEMNLRALVHAFAFSSERQDLRSPAEPMVAARGRIAPRETGFLDRLKSLPSH